MFIFDCFIRFGFMECFIIFGIIEVSKKWAQEYQKFASVNDSWWQMGKQYERDTTMLFL